MNHKILLSGLSIFSALVFTGAATFAFFSDEGTSSGNVFASGTMDMLLSDDDQTDLDDVNATWGLASDPGDTFTGDLKIRNSGSTDADHLELKFTNTVTDAVSGPGTDGSIAMDTVIEITSFLWDHDGDGTPTVDLLTGLIDTNGNGIFDLDDLETQVADDFDDVAFGGTQGTDHVLRIAGRLHPTLTVDQHQGDSVDMDLAVTLNQDSAQ